MKKIISVIAIVAIALIVGCVLWESMSMVISIATIIISALIAILIVAYNYENSKAEDDGE